jgi:sulfide:quinone oxidoreductase
MAKVTQLDPGYSIGAEIHRADVDALGDAGFRTVDSFRPDSESPWQTPFDVVASFASARGMQAVHIPVVAGDLNEAAATSLREILESLPGPVFGYCKSGMRAATAWALSKRGEIPPEAIFNRLHLSRFHIALLEQLLFNPVGLALPQVPADTATPS